MSERVVGRWFAFEVAVLVGCGLLLAAREEPPSERVLELIGAPSAFERTGGLVLNVRFADEARRVELPAVPRRAVPEVESLVKEGVALRRILRGEGLREAYRRAQERAPELAEEIALSQDGDEMGGVWLNPWTFLEGPTRPALERVLQLAKDAGWKPASGERIGFAKIEDPEDPKRTVWLAYELSEAPILADEPAPPILRAAAQPEESGEVALDLAFQFHDVKSRLPFCLNSHRPAILTIGSRMLVRLDQKDLCSGTQFYLPAEDAAPMRVEAIAALLAHPELSNGVTLASSRYVEAVHARGSILLARLLPPLLLGAAAGLLTLLLLGLARPRWRAPAPSLEGVWPWPRVAVTALVPVTLLAMARIPLPGIEMNDQARRLDELGLGAVFYLPVLGIAAVLRGFILVQIFARLPFLWRRRFGRRGQRVFGGAVVVASAAIVIVHAITSIAELRGNGVLADDDLSGALLAGGAMVLTTLVLVGLAKLVDARGLGNGFAVVLASELLLQLVRRAESQLALSYLTATLALLAVGALTGAVLRWRVGGEGGRAGLAVPSTGDAPLAVWPMILLWGGLLAWGLGLELFEETRALRARHWETAASLIMVPLWAWLLARPALVAPAAEAAGLRLPSATDAIRAALISAYFFLGLGVIRLVTGTLRIHDVLLAAVAAAAVLDVIAEGAARRRALASAGILHHIQRAPIVEHVLARAGIDCHLRAGNVRALLSFFGPFAPVTVLVPEERADEARALLAEILTPKGRPPV